MKNLKFKEKAFCPNCKCELDEPWEAFSLPLHEDAEVEIECLECETTFILACKMEVTYASYVEKAK